MHAILERRDACVKGAGPVDLRDEPVFLRHVVEYLYAEIGRTNGPYRRPCFTRWIIAMLDCLLRRDAVARVLWFELQCRRRHSGVDHPTRSARPGTPRVHADVAGRVPTLRAMGPTNSPRRGRGAPSRSRQHGRSQNRRCGHPAHTNSGSAAAHLDEQRARVIDST